MALHPDFPGVLAPGAIGGEVHPGYFEAPNPGIPLLRPRGRREENQKDRRGSRCGNS